MMRRLFVGAALAALAAGCGGGSPKPNTEPMTEEEIRQMNEDDRRIDEEERSGAGTATPAKKRK